MAYNQNNNFWDFARSFDNNNNNGTGVDHTNQPPLSFPFGGPPPSHHGGPHGHPHHPSPPGAFPFGGFAHGGPPHHPGPFPCGGPFEGRGRHGRRGGRCGGRRGSRHAEGPEAHFGQGPQDGTFDLNAFLASLSSHPLAQAFRGYAEQFAPQQQESGEATRGEEDEENNYVPPIDIFSTESHFILHVALPGAKKEDVGINWDVEKGALNIAGVIYRQGDEEFLKALTQSERKVGVFERTVKLPPGANDEKEEVDGDAITAKLEDGVLVVAVPKLEKEWTDVKKVDIE